jgi:glyoxylase-like metal-dependent hydrolase (beta-lactamase superfamily II)
MIERDDATIVPGQATRLAPGVRRVTAPNPSFMTGPGTNSYLLGEGEDVAIIDPGPPNEAHIEALLVHAGGKVASILVTHTHPDHSPAAAILKQRTGARLFGMAPPKLELQDQSFMPDQPLRHGDRMQAGGMWLRAIHTPGHASNHVCYLLESERIVFTGDHVMQGSTVVINPPDGDMRAYLDSLAILRDEKPAYLAPGHGYLIDEPDDLIERLVRHRLFREAKTLNALRRGDGGTLEALVPRVYDDVPTDRHRVAARSLLAHLIKLRDDGLAADEGGRWNAVA